MLPILEGIIARRILVNFRADPTVIASLIPKPLEVLTQKGYAVVGICLIRLEQLRFQGLPKILGMASENMAHRVAVRFKEGGKIKGGVYIWRRDTDNKLTTLLGGRLFPGVHSRSEFLIKKRPGKLSMRVKTMKKEADVQLRIEEKKEWEPSRLFSTFNDACGFFQKGDRGFSCTLDKGSLEGMRLKTLKWEMEPLRVVEVHSAFYKKIENRYPGSIQLDCALGMKGIPHQWHELKNIPELIP